jgi:hypothetical protein
VDEDCDGLVNGADDSVTGVSTFYADTDGDGLGDPDSSWESCYVIDGYVDNADDCDDSDSAVGPEDEWLGCFLCDRRVPGDHDTIQSAIDSAADGELICVELGTWSERLDYDGTDVWVFGLEGPEETIIDGGGTGPVVSISSGEGSGAGLHGFGITGGEAAVGAGIYISASDPTLVDLVVFENTCGTSKGQACEGIGIYLDNASLSMKDIVVRDNYGYFDGWVGFDQSKGAGIYVQDSSLDIDGLVVADNSIEPHAAIETWGVTVWGTGLYASATDATIDNARFTGNSATGTFDDLEESYLLGSAIFLYDGSDFDFSHLLVAGNKLDSYSYYNCGGPLYAWDSSVSITNGIFSHNISRCGSVAGASPMATRPRWPSITWPSRECRYQWQRPFDSAKPMNPVACSDSFFEGSGSWSSSSSFSSSSSLSDVLVDSPSPQAGRFKRTRATMAWRKNRRMMGLQRQLDG